MKKGKIGIALFIMFALLVGGIFLLDYKYDRYDEELLHTVQNVEIGDGVTLIRGLQAFCGTSGDWYSKEDNTVEVVALGAENAVTVILQANVETGSVDLLKLYYDLNLLDRSGAEAVINDMIKAAKG